jgi:hypothetical protein
LAGDAKQRAVEGVHYAVASGEDFRVLLSDGVRGLKGEDAFALEERDSMVFGGAASAPAKTEASFFASP